ncbi:hypothetical protein V6N12_061180 [Hibiscus sabdariffa]|uniref:Disease resistance protein RGA3 n=1 Tax=Hibiscus sabdariffa TaxID=183260 RepID=A0ABR2DWA9_9ROSI
MYFSAKDRREVMSDARTLPFAFTKGLSAKMAISILGAVVGGVASKAASVAAEQMSLAWGFKKQLQRLGNTLEMIGVFLLDAEEKQKEINSVKLWLQRLKDVAHEADDVLDELDYETLRRKVEIGNRKRSKVRNFCSSSNPIVFRLKMANKIKDILNCLDELNKLAKDFGLQQLAIDQKSSGALLEGSNVETVSFLDDSHIVGRKNDVSNVVDLLVSPKDEQVVTVVPIVGMAGIGKTSLARLVYHDVDVESHFDKRFWVCVNDNFDVKRILKEMLDHFPNQHAFVSENLNVITTKLKEKIEQAKGENEQFKYLLVLDDVWNVDKWEELKCCLLGLNKDRGNKVVVTTRIEEVASRLETLPNHKYRPGILKDEECWSIIEEKENPTSVIDEVSHIQRLCIGYDGESLSKLLTVIAPKLHSLFSEIDVFKKLSITFTSLRVLKFSGANILELPASLGEMKHLRYMDISKTCIAALPQSITVLYLFQTLRFMGCQRLTFPDGLRNLINLKHIHFDCESSQPVELQYLTSLQTLPMFSVGISEHRIDALRCLNQLGGELRMCNLEHVRDKQEADGANLDHKEKLCKITFEWGTERECGYYNDQAVLEGLQPHSSLQSLIVRNYAGEIFPSWMLRPTKTGSLLLDNLMELELTCCVNCYRLPPLGQLQSLKFLTLSDMGKVKCMGNEFYCNESCKGKSEVFPALKKFALERMKNLKEWTAMAATIMFPCLEELNVSCCPLLETVPLTGQCLSLQKLHIEKCSNLSSIGNGLATSTSLKELTIESCPGLASIPNLDGFSSLRSLNVLQCTELEIVPVTGRWSSLEELCISGSKKLNKIGQGLSTTTCLKKLILDVCPNLSSIPDLEALSSLRTLGIYGCNKLEFVPIGGRCFSLEKLQISRCEKLSKIGDGPFTSTCLKELKLSGCPNLISIPDLEGLSCLLVLHIYGCDKLEIVPITGRCSSLEELHIFQCEKLSNIGDGLSTCNSLMELKLHVCPNLSSIPDLEGFSSLRNLDIYGCHKLEIVPISGKCSSLEKLKISFCVKLNKIGDGLSTSTCLKEVKLFDCPNLSSIPDLEVFSSLQNLVVSNCGKLELTNRRRSIPESVWELRSLSHLTIRRCPRLRSTPNSFACLRRARRIPSFKKVALSGPRFPTFKKSQLITSVSDKEVLWSYLSSEAGSFEEVCPFNFKVENILADPVTAEFVIAPTVKICKPLWRYPPPVGFLKMDVGGAMKSDGSAGGIGGILRDIMAKDGEYSGILNKPGRQSKES